MSKILETGVWVLGAPGIGALVAEMDARLRELFSDEPLHPDDRAHRRARR
jgi:hypothetical protein